MHLMQRRPILVAALKQNNSDFLGLKIFFYDSVSSNITVVTYLLFTYIGVSTGITSEYHLLMWWTQTSRELCVSQMCVTIWVHCSVGVIACVRVCRQASGESFLWGLDDWNVHHGLYVRVFVCSQDPCAGSQRWIKVTGATVSCSCSSQGTHSTPQTLMLLREMETKKKMKEKLIGIS